MSHTPTPWEWRDWTKDDGPNKDTLTAYRSFVDKEESDLWAASSPQGKPVAIVGCSDCPAENEADKAFIVLACNAHLDLIKALSETTYELAVLLSEDHCTVREARAALRKAQKEEMRS